MTSDRVRPPRRGVSVEWAALWVILVLAFALSFRALFDVGQAAGLGSLSWALPVIVDGFAVLAARVIEHLESKWARLYPWALLIGLVGVSSWWNALHAGGEVVLDPNVAAVVAGAPPVILGLAYHLLRMSPVHPPGVLFRGQIGSADHRAAAVGDRERSQCCAAHKVVLISGGTVGLQVSACRASRAAEQDHATPHRASSHPRERKVRSHYRR